MGPRLTCTPDVLHNMVDPLNHQVRPLKMNQMAALPGFGEVAFRRQTSKLDLLCMPRIRRIHVALQHTERKSPEWVRSRKSLLAQGAELLTPRFCCSDAVWQPAKIANDLFERSLPDLL